MASLKFDTYQIETESATYVGSIEWDPDVDSPVEIAQRTNKVLEALKRKDLIVSPNGEEAAWIIGKPKSRGSKVVVPEAAVAEVFRLYVEEDDAVTTIPLKIYADKRFEGVILQSGTVSKILKGERDQHVEVGDGHREAAKVKLGDGSKGRRKYTEADKEEWVRLHVEENMSGSAIGKKLGINSSIINTELREQNVQRNRRGSVKAVNTA